MSYSKAIPAHERTAMTAARICFVLHAVAAIGDRALLIADAGAD